MNSTARRFCCVLLAFFVIFPAVYAAAEEPAPPLHEWWIASGREAIVLVDPGPKLRARVEVGPALSAVVRSPDGATLAVGSSGDMTTNVTWSLQSELWPKAGGAKSQVTLVNSADYKVLGKLEVPFRPDQLAFTSDQARLVVVSAGQMSKNKQKQVAPQVTLVDVRTLKIISQTTLTSAPIDIWQPAGSARVLIPCQGFKPGTPVPAELAVLNTTTGAVEKIALPSAVKRWHEMDAPDRRYLELENHVVVVTADGKLAGDPLAVGAELLLFGPAGEGKSRYYMAGKTAKQGQLALLEGGSITKSVSVPPAEAVVLDAANSRLFVCAKKQGMMLDSRSLEKPVAIPLPGGFHEVMLDPDKKRLYVNATGDHVSVLDIESAKQIASFTSGRGSVKFMQELAAASAQMLSQIQYQMTGVPGTGWNAQAPTAVQSMAFSPSGNFVYVFNSATSDITVVETKTFTSTKKVPTGYLQGSSLWRTPSGDRLVSVAMNKLVVFDTEKGEVITEQQFPKSTLDYDPTLGLLLVSTREATDVYETAPLKKIKSLPPLKKVQFQPDARRFFALTDKGLSLFDYDLNLAQELEGVTAIPAVRRIPLAPPPVAN